MLNVSEGFEEWKRINVFDKIFEVSSLGRVRSVDTIKISTLRGTIYTYPRNGKIRKLSTDKRGYSRISVNDKTVRIHRLVAEAFHPNPNNLPQVNHINGIKSDNRSVNLEWCTNEYNMHHAIVNGHAKKAKGVKHGLAKLTKQQVIEIRRIFNSTKISHIELGKRFNISNVSIQKIVTNKSYKDIL